MIAFFNGIYPINVLFLSSNQLYIIIRASFDIIYVWFDEVIIIIRK